MALIDWPIPRSAYVHIPFCRHHCGYCNFTVITSRPGLQEAYLQALEWELRAYQTPRPVDTLYLGGGTPSELSEGNLAKCLQLCRTWFPLTEGGEFTVEVNPEDVSTGLMEQLKHAGVNRISLGIQSFDDLKLNRLERRHTGQGAIEAVHQVAAVIDNVSVDLIFAAPHETQDAWLEEIAILAQLPIKHVSAYGLTYEKGSAFYGQLQRKVLQEIDEDTQVEMFCATQRNLHAIGLEQYEVSNYAKRGFASRHNQAYWEGRGWYGAGAGAAKFENGLRAVNDRSTTRYIRRLQTGASPVAESDQLSVEQWALERVAFGLRRLEGVDLASIATESGIDIATWLQPVIDRLVPQKLLQLHGSNLRIPVEGLLVSDRIVAEILQCEAKSTPR